MAEYTTLPILQSVLYFYSGFFIPVFKEVSGMLLSLMYIVRMASGRVYGFFSILSGRGFR
ncbi:hypothetical protein JCM6292_1334 [Bacteroides pyogenes JCM 6292]|uniref:Uncharacterized protein n=1 Tax=Bacteroides pyogenes JCM 6292 TaxID=1235809 RepID=W4P7I4_9BACE|nr:hypothetical protein JCM6292_1334 [Bacteroides pyogenes JCM 6292]